MDTPFYISKLKLSYAKYSVEYTSVVSFIELSLPHFQTSELSSEKYFAARRIFNFFSMFENVVKHGVLCLICYLTYYFVFSKYTTNSINSGKRNRGNSLNMS